MARRTPLCATNAGPAPFNWLAGIVTRNNDAVSMKTRVTAFRNDGLVFPVVDCGPLDGPVVMLLHGFPQNAHCWDGVSPALNEAGYRTLAPDLRGYADTNSPQSVDEYRLDVMVGDVLAAAETVGAQRLHLVGHDWGGTLAWVTAGAHPSTVLTVTAISTPHPQAMAVAIRQGPQARKSWYVRAFALPVLPQRVLPWLSGRLAREIGPRAERYVQGLSVAQWSSRLNWYRANPAAGLEGPLQRCNVNATYVWGRHDPYLGELAAHLTAQYVSGDYEFVPVDAGHWLPEQHPQECAQAILRRLATGL